MYPFRTTGYGKKAQLTLITLKHLFTMNAAISPVLAALIQKSPKEIFTAEDIADLLVTLNRALVLAAERLSAE